MKASGPRKRGQRRYGVWKADQTLIRSDDLISEMENGWALGGQESGRPGEPELWPRHPLWGCWRAQGRRAAAGPLFEGPIGSDQMI